jgi:hypothetical protein
MSKSITVGDYALIMEAEKVHYTDWDKVDEMIDRAKSKEAKEILRGIRNRLNHLEEFRNDNL